MAGAVADAVADDRVVPIVAGLLSPLVTPLPDVLVSGDARLIALRDGAGYAVQSVGGAKFTREEWESHFAAGPFVPIRDGVPADCDGQACRVGPVLMARNKERVPEAACAGAALLVAAEPARGECPHGVALLDRFTVWRDGAAAAWVEGDRVRVVTDREVRGDRPWVPRPPTPRKVTSDLPPAAQDSLPPADSE